MFADLRVFAKVVALFNVVISKS